MLKPDHREMSSLRETEKLEYLEVLREQDAIVSDLYRVSNPSRRFSGWGTNLARTGAELSLRLINEGGVCGFVSPASLIADQRSEQLRNWIFTEHEVRDLAYYPAEARLFEKVDQPSITLVVLRTRRREDIPPVVSKYNAKLEKSVVKIPLSEWKDLANHGYVVPLQFGASLIGQLKEWKTLPRVLDLERDALQPLWAGRELDETDRQRYLADKGDYLFVKGKLIRRFEIAEQPLNYIRPGGPKIPKSAGFHRLVWRDVARPSQKRRMHATIIPPGWVAGNSLNVAYFQNADVDRLKALLAVFNSFMFEAQVRALSATGHISLGTVRQVRVPELSDMKIVNKLAVLTDQCLAGDSLARTRVEVAVSRLYGVNRVAFERIVKCFEKVDPTELSTLLACPEWKI
jgi:Alw26I/Eco31I/Esp3I family type II restriction m6 adenine DNA methyltransferase